LANKRLQMRNLREIFRLRHEHGLSHRAIARACGVGTATVSTYLKRGEQVGLGWPVPQEWDDAALEAKLFPGGRGSGPQRSAPDFAWIHKELKRPGVTLQLLWLEYMQTHPGGYRYSRFCEIYRRWARKLHPTMRQVHKAGEKVFVDYSGKRPWVVDRRTGEARPVELFVGVLGASNFIYAEATPAQDLPSWIGAHVRMFEAWGGCCEILVPDNLKSGITTPCRYEAEVNRTYAEMAAHYGAVVIPARSGRARDKGKVEVGVLLAQRWILAVLRNRTFFTLAELNQAIWEQLPILNDRLMKQLGKSRRELFEELDQPSLRPLPAGRYEMAAWKECGVNIDYHVQVEHNFYSVPYHLIHERVEARLTHSVVEVFYRSKRVASHKRLRGRGQASTQPEHMPSSHRAHAEWTPSRITQWAGKTGPATGRVAAEILRSRPHPEQGFRSCLGLMRLGKTHGAERLEAACRRAERIGSFSYRTVKNILSAGFDRLPLLEDDDAHSPAPAHDNLRGAAYYEDPEVPC